MRIYLRGPLDGTHLTGLFGSTECGACHDKPIVPEQWTFRLKMKDVGKTATFELDQYTVRIDEKQCPGLGDSCALLFDYAECISGTSVKDTKMFAPPYFRSLLWGALKDIPSGLSSDSFGLYQPDLSKVIPGLNSSEAEYLLGSVWTGNCGAAQQWMLQDQSKDHYSEIRFRRAPNRSLRPSHTLQTSANLGHRRRWMQPTLTHSSRSVGSQAHLHHS